VTECRTTDNSVDVYRDGHALTLSFRKDSDRRFWLVCLYQDFEHMLAPGVSGVARAVVDDFGNLVRVSK
jgi:hypothetical protein